MELSIDGVDAAVELVAAAVVDAVHLVRDVVAGAVSAGSS